MNLHNLANEKYKESRYALFGCDCIQNAYTNKTLHCCFNYLIVPTRTKINVTIIPFAYTKYVFKTYCLQMNKMAFSC